MLLPAQRSTALIFGQRRYKIAITKLAFIKIFSLISENIRGKISFHKFTQKCIKIYKFVKLQKFELTAKDYFVF